MAYNLLRAAGALTSAFHAKATTATLLVQVPARIARSAQRVTLYLPRNWRWQKAWTHLFDTAHPNPPDSLCPPRPPGPTGTKPWKSWADQRMQHAHAHRPTQNRLRSPSEDHAQTTSADRGLGGALVTGLVRRGPGAGVGQVPDGVSGLVPDSASV